MVRQKDWKFVERFLLVTKENRPHLVSQFCHLVVLRRYRCHHISRYSGQSLQWAQQKVQKVCHLTQNYVRFVEPDRWGAGFEISGLSLVAAEELNFIAKTLDEKHWRRTLKAVMKTVEDNRPWDIIISLLYTVKTTGNQFYNIELE